MMLIQRRGTDISVFGIGRVKEELNDRIGRCSDTSEGWCTKLNFIIAYNIAINDSFLLSFTKYEMKVYIKKASIQALDRKKKKKTI